jgi:16S rRNA (cytosine1402-N4)-methyltransferase
MSDAYHIPVLLHESVSALNIDPNGIYVDVTFGGGGHSKAILEKLGPNGRLFAFDQDQEAASNAPDDDRFLLLQWNYRHIQRILRVYGVEKVNGILADLGVSSHQFDDADRGFSYRNNAELDMRMNSEAPIDAIGILANYTADQLQEMFSRNAELRNARQLAHAIVEQRSSIPFRTTTDLLQIAESVMKGEKYKYLAQVFQAIRIEVNDELTSLQEMLEATRALLLPGGRLVVISYHSLEDKLVKAALRNDAEIAPTNMTGEREEFFKIISKKPVLPKQIEMKKNPRANSAKMRVAERMG